MVEYLTYKESGIPWVGCIPNHWDVKRGKNVLILLDRPVIDGDEVITCFRDGEVTLRKNRREDGFTVSLQEIGYQGIEPGDLVVHGMDGFAGAIGVSDSRGKGTPVLNVMDSDHNKRFLMYYLRAAAYKDVFMSLSTGIRVRSCDLRWNKISVFPFVLPERNEQDLIVQFLDGTLAKVDATISEAKSSIEEYKSWKASIIYEAVTRGLNPDVEIKDSGIDWIGMIPAHWTLSRVKNIGSTQNGVSKGGDYFGEGYPFVNYGDVYKNYELPRTGSGLANASPEDRETYSVQYGDIFFTRTSETAEEVGFSAVCMSTIENATFSGFVIRLRPYIVDSVIQTNFAKYYFRSPHIRNYLVKEMNIVTRVSLSQSLLRDMSVTVPPIDEQDRISHYLDDKCEQIDSVIREKTALIDDLEAYKKSLIYEVVTGKKKVK